MDSCLLLPQHFRSRLNALPLEAESSYLLPAAKRCDDMEMLMHLRGCEPWERAWAEGEPETRGILLYHLKNWHIRRQRDWVKMAVSETSDEVREVRTEMRRVLPFYALRIDHTPGRMQEWLERPSIPLDFAALCRKVPGGPGTVLVAGYHPGGRWEEISRGADTVHLIDVFQLKSEHADPAVEADRGALRRELESIELGLPRVVHHEAGNAGRLHRKAWTSSICTGRSLALGSAQPCPACFNY
jgi:hypothetical protein